MQTSKIEVSQKLNLQFALSKKVVFILTILKQK